MPDGNERLLVATAPSTTSSHALDWALRRAEEGWSGPISVLSVDEPSSLVHDATGAAIHDRHRTVVERSVRRAGLERRPPVISDARKAGRKARTIAAECTREDLVLADYTRPPLLPWLTGSSLPQRLVATTPCPAGVVPHAWHESRGRVVLLLRGRRLRQPLAIAAREARAAGIPLDLVRLRGPWTRLPAERSVEGVLASPLLRSLEVRIWPRPLAVRSVLRALRPADLVVVPRTRQGAFRGVVTGAVEQRLLRRLRFPLLVVPA